MAEKTRYVTNGGVSIAYQVTGDAPIDLVVVPGFISHLELDWTNPWSVEYMRSLTSFCRLIRFDKRGTGLSDPIPGVPTLEERMEDVRAVMDAVGCKDVALLGISEGGPMAALFAATYPERTRALILYGSFAAGSGGAADGGMIADYYPAILDIIDDWGEGRMLERFAPSIVNDENARRMMGTYERSAASPGMARAVIDAIGSIDVRPILPSIQAPTLVLHRTGDLIAPIAAARYMAEAIPEAKLVELEGDDHIIFLGDRQRAVHEIEEFLTGARHVHEPDRVLATVLFTDIVASTERAAEMGDTNWRELLQHHDAAAAAEIENFRGRVVKSLGDGVLATFDGPARAIRCAEALQARVSSELGIALRAGVHTGECEAIGDDLGGLAVHIGARVAAQAAAGEIVVSGTVRDLVVGSGLAFEDAGEHELRGVPGRWRLYRVAGREPVPKPLEPAAVHMTAGDKVLGRIARRAPGAVRALTRLTVKEREAAQ